MKRLSDSRIGLKLDALCSHTVREVKLVNYLVPVNRLLAAVFGEFFGE